MSFIQPSGISTEYGSFDIGGNFLSVVNPGTGEINYTTLLLGLLVLGALLIWFKTPKK